MVINDNFLIIISFVFVSYFSFSLSKIFRLFRHILNLHGQSLGIHYNIKFLPWYSYSGTFYISMIDNIKNYFTPMNCILLWNYVYINVFKIIPRCSLRCLAPATTRTRSPTAPRPTRGPTGLLTTPKIAQGVKYTQ